VLQHHVKSEQILPVVGLPTRLAVAHYNTFANGANAQSRERHRVWEVTAQVLEGTQNALARNLCVYQRPGSAQHNQVSKGEAVFAARATLRLYEPSSDQAADGTARQVQNPLHVVHTVGRHLYLVGPNAWLLCAPA